MSDGTPRSMQPFVAAIGASATMSVMRVFGGARIYVPRPSGLDDAHPLVNLLGRPLAEKLAQHVGGQHHDVCRAADAEAAARNAEIRERFRRGISVRAIALQLAISTKTVRRALGEGGTDAPQDKVRV